MNVITRGVERIASIALHNQDRLIQKSPISIDVEIYHTTAQNDLFGYEDLTPGVAIRSKAIIKFSPERSFLKSNAIFMEEGTDLPVIGWFLSTDNIKKLDRIKLITKDGDTLEYAETLQVVNIKTKGAWFQHSFLYILAPYRGTN